MGRPSRGLRHPGLPLNDGQTTLELLRSGDEVWVSKIFTYLRIITGVRCAMPHLSLVFRTDLWGRWAATSLSALDDRVNETKAICIAEINSRAPGAPLIYGGPDGGPPFSDSDDASFPDGDY